MEISFVPDCMRPKNDVPAKFSGDLKMEVPEFSERLLLQAEFATIPKDDSPESKRTQLLMIADLAKRVRPMVKSVNVQTTEEPKASATNVEELYGHPAFDTLVTEITLGALRGFAGN